MYGSFILLAYDVCYIEKCACAHPHIDTLIHGFACVFQFLLVVKEDKYSSFLRVTNIFWKGKDSVKKSFLV